MLQIIGSLSNGKVELMDLPIPSINDNEVLIKSKVIPNIKGIINEGKQLFKFKYKLK